MELFEPFRVIGSICGSVPISATSLYGVAILMVATGRTYQLYKGKELALIRGGPSFMCNITAVAQSGKYRCVAEGPRVHGYVHHKLLWTQLHETLTCPTVHLLLAQDDLLFCAGSDKRVVIRAIKNGEVLQEILVAESASVTQMVLPTGYSNKLLLATEEGKMMLYNFKTGELLWNDFPATPDNYNINNNNNNNNNNYNHSYCSHPCITALTCSSYKDVIAYGTSAGDVIVMNLATNELITAFTHQGSHNHTHNNNNNHYNNDNDVAVAVTALAFRTDRDGFLLSATAKGEIAIWDLHERCLDGMLTRHKQVRTLAEIDEGVHHDLIHSLLTFTLPGMQSLVISGGCDNALVQFRFDTVDGVGLLTRERRGHAGSCSCSKFYNHDLILSCGSSHNDHSLRVTHVFSDRASWELSQNKLRGKRAKRDQYGATTRKQMEWQLPAITSLASCTTRANQWSSVVSLHMGSSYVCGWRTDNKHLEFKLSGIKTGCHVGRCVAMSACGNFVIVGYSSGNVTRISIQNKSIHQLFDHTINNSNNNSNNNNKKNNSTVTTNSSNAKYLKKFESEQEQEQEQQSEWKEEVKEKQVERAHWGSVECVEVACGNSIIVTAGMDQTIKMWGLLDCQLRQVISTCAPLTKSCLHEASSLFIAAQHHNVCVYHCNPDAGLGASEMQTPVREFAGHQSAITALALAPDTFRYVVSASSDAVLLIWDLAAAACVGQYKMHRPALSLSFHPEAFFLLSTHAEETGVCAWVNNLRYGFVPEVIEHPENKVWDELPWLHFPTSHGGTEVDENESDLANAESVYTKHNIKKNYCVNEECHDANNNEDESDEENNTRQVKKHHKINALQDQENSEYELFDIEKDVALRRTQMDMCKSEELNAIDTHGVRLSNLPKSVWMNLTMLDFIKEKNQPLLPPKKKDVPFFLQTTEALRPTFMISAESIRESKRINDVSNCNKEHFAKKAEEQMYTCKLTQAETSANENSNDNHLRCETKELASTANNMQWTMIKNMEEKTDITDIIVSSNNEADNICNNIFAEKDDSSKHVIRCNLTSLTHVQCLLKENKYDELINYIVMLKTAQAIDLELKELVDYVEGAMYSAAELELTRYWLTKFVEFMTYWVHKQKHADIIQAILKSFTRTFGPLISQLGGTMTNTLDMLILVQDKLRRTIDHLISYPCSLANQAIDHNIEKVKK